MRAGASGSLLSRWIWIFYVDWEHNPTSSTHSSQHGEVMAYIIKCEMKLLVTSKFKNWTDEVWEWLSNVIPHLIMDVIIYPCWSMLVTHERNERNANLQTTFANAFPSMKILVLWLKFHWSLFRRVRLTTCKHWFGWWLGVEQGTTTKGDKIYWRMYASLGLNELPQYLSSRQRMFYWRHIEMRFVHSIFLKLIPMSFEIVAVRFDRQKSTLVPRQANTWTNGDGVLQRFMK